MTKADTARLIGYIVLAYPNADKYKDDEQVGATVNLWARIFKDDDPALVALAVDKHISTSKWPPSVAEIREIMAEIASPDLIPPDMAWTAVADVMYSNGEYMHGDLQAIFPPLIARVVEAIGWHTLYELHRGSYAGNRDGMDRVAFMDLYKPAYERARQTAMITPALREGIGRVQAAITDGNAGKLQIAEGNRRKKDDQYREIELRQFARLEESLQKQIEGRQWSVEETGGSDDN